ncbi:MAG TPA: zinc-binding dehydrogenase [Thermoanaerobaculia bacterium]|nr:zinc-binding dehydrogenase [Thermoanaerobaculia bacterium]
MHAWRISRHGGPEVLEWVELPDPRPGPGEAVVAVRACALNHLDIWIRRGVEGVEYPLPLIPGSEVAGDVEALGEGVEGFAPGDPVLVAPGLSCGECAHCRAGDDPLCRQYGILGETRDGGYAEKILVPARNLLPLPRGLSYAEAAAIPLVFLTAWRMLATRARLRSGEDVLIHAAGSGVSSAAIQIVRLLGARVIVATASAPEKLERARQLGATHTVDYRNQDFVLAAREATGGKGVEVVVDHVGGEVFERSLKALARGGRIVLCGATAGHEVRINLRAVFFRSLSILGSTMGGLEELKYVLQKVEAGELRPVVDRTFPLAEAPRAQEVLERREQFGKIVLTLE